MKNEKSVISMVSSTKYEYPVVKARFTILIAIAMLFLSNGSIRTNPAPYGPELPTAEESVAVEREIAASLYMRARDEKMWGAIVQKIAGDLLIPDDLELAERIAHAIEDSTSEFGVDPWLMVSLIRVESAGNPKAISHVGARGLTQIMPITGREIARDLGLKWEGQEILYDVETSIRFGTYYLSKLLTRFDGNMHAAVAAYNWGPENIAKRLRKGERLPVVYPGKVLSRYAPTPPWASS